MKIARYWESTYEPAQFNDGKPARVKGWGWSETSPEEALQRARAAAKRSAQWLATGSAQAQDYAEYDRPPREEILREIQNENGEVIATITRNSYGTQVINAARLVFIDVDIPRESGMNSLTGGLKKLFGKPVETAEEKVRKRIEAAAHALPQYTFRLYRTAAGFRCMITNVALDTRDARRSGLLETFGADALYLQLCWNQECYRARLTPKPWRVGVQRPPSRFPWLTPEEEQKYRLWQRDYEGRLAGYAVCRFETQYGRELPARELEPLIALHDEMTGASSGLQLA